MTVAASCALQRFCGASIEGAMKLNHEQAQTVINWSGGLHHGKKGEVSNFIPMCTALCLLHMHS